MLRSITFIFDDNAEITMTGEGDKIAEMIKGHTDIKGMIVHEERYEPTGNGWDIDSIKKIIDKKTLDKGVASVRQSNSEEQEL